MAQIGIETRSFYGSDNFAFNESQNHARGAPDLFKVITFPTEGATVGQLYDVRSDSKSGSLYTNGSYVAIFFNSIPSALGNDDFFSPAGNSVVGPGGGGVTRFDVVYNLPSKNWSFISADDYFGTGGNPGFFAVAKWTNSEFTTRIASPVQAGKYVGTCGLLSIWQNNNNFTRGTNNITGSVRFTIISADLTQETTVTPPGAGVSIGGGGTTNFTIDSVALLGSGIAFYPKLYISGMVSPIGSNSGSVQFGGQWTANI